MNCDVCGRSMTSKSGNSVQGINIILGDSSEDKNLNIKEIYPEIELHRDYKVCIVCWLRSLGVMLK